MGLAIAPATLALVSTAATVAAAGVAYASQASAANTQAQIARNNQAIADQNAARATAAGEIKAANISMAGKQKAGAIKAGIAAGGIDVNSGSAADVLESENKLTALDAMTMRSNAAQESYNFQTQGANAGLQSDLYKREVGYAGGESLLSGASSFAGGYGKYLQNTSGVTGS